MIRAVSTAGLSEFKIPASIERRQFLFLDGIQTSVQMAQISYRRLQATLAPENSVERHVEAALDAWAIVDTLNRLRVLIGATPGLRGNSSGVQLIKRALKPVEDLRHAVQHMDREISSRLANDIVPLWGYVAWLQHDERGLRSRTLLAGLRLPSGPITVASIHPAGRTIESPVGPIELTAAGTTISLSELVAASVTFAERLGLAVTLAVGSLAPCADDHCLTLNVG